MSFWNTDVGTLTGAPEDAFAKSIRTIPDGTKAVAKIEGFKNKDYQGNPYLEIEWLLTTGDFKGFYVFQKIKVFDKDEKARFRALNLLMLLYNMYDKKPLHNKPPSDDDLRVFIGKHAGIKIQETEPNDQGKVYNWVSEIHPADGFKDEAGSHRPSPPQSAFQRNAPKVTDEQFLNDDIPF